MGKEKRKVTLSDLTRFYEGHNCLGSGMGAECEKCELYYYKNNPESYCTDFILKHPNEANEIIMKWCDEHPIKTRQSEFLKLFPNTLKDKSGVIMIAPCQIDKDWYETNETNETNGCKKAIECGCGNCLDCRRNYWSGKILMKE